MIKQRDAFKFARLKFTNYKFRNIFSSFTVALGIIIVLTSAIALNGILHVARPALKDQFADKSYASMYLACDMSNQNTPNPNSDICNKDSISESVVKAKFAKFDIASVSGVKTIGTPLFELRGIKKLIPQTNAVQNAFNYNSPSDNGLNTIEPHMLKDYYFSGFNMEDKYEGKIPVVVSQASLSSNYNMFAESSEKEKYQAKQQLINTVKGKSFFLDSYAYNEQDYFKDPNPTNLDNAPRTQTKIEVVVVGLITPGLLVNNFNNGIYLPHWAAEKNSELKKLFTEQHFSQAIVEFKTKSDRDGFISEQTQSLAFGGTIQYAIPLTSKFEIFEGFVNAVTVVVLVIGGILFAISALFVLTTVGKITNDSRKEIALYRAFGALKSDIQKIFFSYTLILTVLGFIIGLIISLIICILLSLAIGSEFYYTIINLGTNYDVAMPILFFVNIPWTEVVASFIFVNLLGIVAAIYPIIKASQADPINVLRE